MPKNRLELDLELDFQLIGIVSPMKDYRICWHCNRVLRLELNRTEDISFDIDHKQKIARFSKFEFEDELIKSSFTVVSNKHLGENLIPELREVDFFMLVRGDYFDNRMNVLLRALNKIPSVQTAFHIDANSLRSKENLVFE